jgi:hypothetical protein
MRAICAAADSVNQTFPSGPFVIAHGLAFGVVTANSATLLLLVILPTLLALGSVNHTFPSDPTVMFRGEWSVPSAISVAEPVVGALPIELIACSANQIVPSAVCVIPNGSEDGVGVSFSAVTLPEVVMVPILLVPASVNRRVPSSVPTIVGP